MLRFVRVTAASLTCFALLGAAALPASAEDGNIIIKRDVQPRVAVRAPLAPDPNPTQVNANVAPQVNRMLTTSGVNELGDEEFASVTSGSAMQAATTPGGNLDSLTSQVSNSTTTANLGGNSMSGGGMGNRIANTVNDSVQRGLAPLQAIGGGR
ncbi:hypothetical protein [Pseudomonas schmalbachii]|uniref:Fap n=1 Tax=Pseudomonas schmalbachii TaxID=2816993 RepID=A0ABS3TJD0_9PSED|nr:hypothetical protein [Pseudomonas schmalbachii]MBO3273757.1 hypothetical protein [Pseudomonas schmalbachii]